MNAVCYNRLVLAVLCFLLMLLFVSLAGLALLEQKEIYISPMELLTLSFVFLKIGAVTFGGGLAMLPILEVELCQKRNWLSCEELLDYYAIGQVTPGIIAVNVATFVGHKKHGILGAIVATLSIATPSIIVITVIAIFVSGFQSILWVQKALKGINIAVPALLTYSVINFSKKSVKTMYGLLLCLLSFVLIFFFKVSSVWLILASSVAGCLSFIFGGAKKQRQLQESQQESQKEKQK